MKIAIVGTVGIPSNYGGFESLVESIAPHLASKEHHVTVYCSSHSYASREKIYKRVNRQFLPLSANGKQSVLYDIISIFHAAIFSDIILILGVSGAICLPLLRLFCRKKIIVNVDGIEWKRDKWRPIAKRFLRFSESIAVKYSDIVIGDNNGIIDYLESEYKIKARLVEYGAPQFSRSPQENVKKEDYFFTVCRIEPENQVDLLLKTFDESDVKIKYYFVGNWDTSVFGQQLKTQYNNHDRICLLDPIYNQNKLRALRSQAFVYLHGHTAGGTNPSLIEAMMEGLPICCAGVNFNRYTTENRAFYFDNSEELKHFFSNLDEDALRECGLAMSGIARRRYTEERIQQLYEEILSD